MTEFKIPDEETKQRDRYEEMSSLTFRPVRIEFYPEDLAKAETMEHDEKMDLIIRLRQEGRYIEIDDAPAKE